MDRSGDRSIVGLRDRGSACLDDDGARVKEGRILPNIGLSVFARGPGEGRRGAGESLVSRSLDLDDLRSRLSSDPGCE